MNRTAISSLCLLFLSVATVSAQQITLAPADCLPRADTAAVKVQVRPELQPGDEVRLNFRRLNTAGAYYYVRFNPIGNGEYWAVFPKPESREQQQLNDDWWEVLRERDWMATDGRDREWLEAYLNDQEYEAAEYFVSIVDLTGAERTRSKTQLAEIQDGEDCKVALTVAQHGQSQNLIIGETSEVQVGHEVFHWLCDGIVTRIDTDGVLRPDDQCRACVVAGWFPVTTSASALIAGTTIEKREPRRTSAVQP